jgi:hypothetical protein
MTSLPKHLKTIIAAGLLLVLAAAFLTPAFARIVINTVDTVATLADNGRHIIVTGPLEFPAGERALVRVTITQRETGAVAEGATFVIGTGAVQQFEVRARLLGRMPFCRG